MTPRPTGCIKDPYDARDRILSAAPMATLPLNATVPNRPAVRNQGYVRNSCTGHATAWMLQQVFASRGMAAEPLSASFLWWYSRARVGQQNENAGSSLRIVFQVARELGAAPLELWTDHRPVAEEPDQGSRLYAAAMRIPAYERCDTVARIKYAIAVERQSVVVGTQIFKHWFNPPHDGVLPYDSMAEPAGNHAFVADGYDDEVAGGVMWGTGSWGDRYGLAGRFAVPYEHLEREWFDAWTPGFDSIPDHQTERTTP